MLQEVADFEKLSASFSWIAPKRYNVGVDVCDRHATGPARTALIVEEENGTVSRYSFHDLKRLSNRLANVFCNLDLRKGDRVAILLPQSLEVAVTHIASFKAGLISVPLFALFGEDALHFRLNDSGARLLVTDKAGLAKLSGIRGTLPALTAILCTDGRPDGGMDFQMLVAASSDDFNPVETTPDDPAVIIYTSGTTGNPKGALHGHRILLGHLPGVEIPHDFPPKPGDLFWTPADWAWIGGLFDVLMPALHFGIPVLARRFGKFDPHQAVELMARHGVRNVFLPPTALKLMRQSGVMATGVSLRTIASGGETLGSDLLDWAHETFGVTVNEFYGQTECNVVIGNNGELLPIRPGSMGRAIPGHRVAVVDHAGNEVRRGTIGNIAVRRPDPVMFLAYWNNPIATAAKFVGDWMLTGDLGHQDDEGYFWYFGRNDDIITSAGYRIGPTEIEECLMRHPSVALAAVIGVPDPIRTESIMAYLTLCPGQTPSVALQLELQAFVRDRLGAHEYPRIICFVDDLPTTSTGKIMRGALRKRAISERTPPLQSTE